MKKTSIRDDELIAMLGEIHLAKDQARYFQDGIVMKMVKPDIITDVMTKFKTHYLSVKMYKAIISQEPETVPEPLPAPGEGSLFCCIFIFCCIYLFLFFSNISFYTFSCCRNIYFWYS